MCSLKKVKTPAPFPSSVASNDCLLETTPLPKLKGVIFMRLSQKEGKVVVSL